MAGTYIKINGESMLIERDGPLGEGHITKSTTGGSVTLTDAEQAGKLIEFTGTLASNATINFTAKDGAIYTLYNNTSGNYTLTAKVTGQTGVVVGQGKRIVVYCDGTDIRLACSDLRGMGVGLPASVGNIVFSSDANRSLTYVEQQNGYLNITGTLTAGRNLALAENQVGFWMVFNNGTGQAVTLIGTSGTGTAVANNKRALCFFDGTNMIRCTADSP